MTKTKDGGWGGNMQRVVQLDPSNCQGVLTLDEDSNESHTVKYQGMWENVED